MTSACGFSQGNLDRMRKVREYQDFPENVFVLPVVLKVKLL